jgi:hypothetical protein
VQPKIKQQSVFSHRQLSWIKMCPRTSFLKEYYFLPLLHSSLLVADISWHSLAMEEYYKFWLCLKMTFLFPCDWISVFRYLYLYIVHVFINSFFLMVEIEPRTLCFLSTYSTTQLHPTSSFFIYVQPSHWT